MLVPVRSRRPCTPELSGQGPKRSLSTCRGLQPFCAPHCLRGNPGAPQPSGLPEWRGQAAWVGERGEREAGLSEEGRRAAGGRGRRGLGRAGRGWAQPASLEPSLGISDQMRPLEAQTPGRELVLGWASGPSCRGGPLSCQGRTVSCDSGPAGKGPSLVCRARSPERGHPAGTSLGRGLPAQRPSEAHGVSYVRKPKRRRASSAPSPRRQEWVLPTRSPSATRSKPSASPSVLEGLVWLRDAISATQTPLQVPAEALPCPWAAEDELTCPLAPKTFQRSVGGRQSPAPRGEDRNS